MSTITKSMIALGFASAMLVGTPTLSLARPIHKAPQTVEQQAPWGAWGAYGNGYNAYGAARDHRAHSSNPAFDVYNDGHYVGSDPDPRIRSQLGRDNDN